MPTWTTFLIDSTKNLPSDIFIESPYFKGTSVRKGGLDFSYTVEELDTKEIIKHVAPDISEVEKFFGFVPFEFQKDAFGKLLNRRFNILHTCRQAGSTTMLAALTTVKLLGDKKILMITPNGKMAEHFVTKVKDYIIKTPFYLQPGVVGWNMRSLNFDTSLLMTRDAKALSKMADLNNWLKTFDLIIFDGIDYMPEFNVLFNIVMTLTTSSEMCVAVSTYIGDKYGIIKSIVENIEESASPLKLKNVWAYHRITGLQAFGPDKLQELKTLHSKEEYAAEFEKPAPPAGYAGTPEDIMNAPSPFKMMINGGIEETDIQAYDRIMNDTRGILEATGTVPPHIIMQNLEIIYKLLRK